MYGKYVCEICKNEHSDVISYINCVTACGEKLKKEKEEAEAKKYIEEVNAALNRIKEAEKYLKEVKREFKEKHPKEYGLNFGENIKSPDYEKVKAVSKEETEKDNERPKVISMSYVDNGKDKPKLSARVNGQEVDDDFIEKLFDDPEIRHLTRMLEFK